MNRRQAVGFVTISLLGRFSSGFGQTGDGQSTILSEYDYPFIDYWDSSSAHILGNVPGLKKDLCAAERIVNTAPKQSPLEVMQYFADLKDVGSTGEPFNARWKYYENPVIVWFFHATGLRPNGDCTSWCAAFLSWCLERCGLASMHSASSQSYLCYGKEVAAPARGDIVVFQNVGNPSFGHVALFLEEIENTLYVIGGNQGGGAQIKNCPPGYPVTTIGRQWRTKADDHQVVKGYRRYST
jgi:uncharacterized protein (TIGR02594 family)